MERVVDMAEKMDIEKLVDELLYASYDEGIEKLRELGLEPECELLNNFDTEGADQVKVSLNDGNGVRYFVILSYPISDINDVSDANGFWDYLPEDCITND